MKARAMKLAKGGFASRRGRAAKARDLRSKVRALLPLLRRAGATVATAESCTGGRVAAALTALAGSSDVFVGGVVSYADSAKSELLGIPAARISAQGAVNAAVARDMAESIRKRLLTTFGLGVTGFAGPGGGTPSDPVGTVYIALAGPKGTEVVRLSFSGSRAAVVTGAALALLRLLQKAIATLR